MQRILRTAFFVAACAFASSGSSADEVRKLASEARMTSDLQGTGEPARLDFFFGDISAWLLRDGNWHIEGNVQHKGALCAEYALGIQFGTGRPGCANVEWIGTPVYVAPRRHCNNALLHHSGGDIDYDAANAFSQVNCAQRLIRCSGNCK
jgi:hypothetical protein